MENEQNNPMQQNSGQEPLPNQGLDQPAQQLVTPPSSMPVEQPMVATSQTPVAPQPQQPVQQSGNLGVPNGDDRKRKDKKMRIYIILGLITVFVLIVAAGVITGLNEAVDEKSRKLSQESGDQLNNTGAETGESTTTTLTYVKPFSPVGWEVQSHSSGVDVYSLTGSSCSLTLREAKDLDTLVETASIDKDSYSVANYYGDQVRGSGVENITEAKTELSLTSDQDDGKQYEFLGNEFTYDAPDGNNYKLVLVARVAGENVLLINMSCLSQDWETDGQVVNELLNSIKLTELAS